MTIRPRDAESYLFGTNANAFLAYTWSTTAGVALPVPTDGQWIGLRNLECNGVKVSPGQSVAGTDTFTGPLILRLRMKDKFSSAASDVIDIVPTAGVPSLLPLFGQVFGFVLYSLAADATQKATVVFF